ncbi:hypothetical protein IWQ60_009540 [Tieghemiomyces parasiticus]|uniref:FHA domain-containing protein n=1 Tax=Tieghemiomyces parasiticus TaxID=78921 RepID=A0A9W8DPY9_9FUNG|nr:hypothetical protein IWQ60_009540 [Tieghemiomyces parasiticus]
MSLPEQNADAAEHPTAPRLPYTAPEGGRAPPSPSYYFEVIKSGVSLEPIDLALDVSFLVVGRLPICDVPLEHPSVSRYHAVIQFHGTAAGPALYDLGSAHGTYVNRRRLPPRTYQAVHVGDHVVFGESTRVYVLQSSLPPEPFIEPPVIAPAHHRPPKREAPVAAPPDAAEAVASSKVPFYAKDPRRVLRDFLERSGYDDDLQFRTVDPDQTGEDFVTYVVLPSELLTGVDAEFSPGRDRKKKASQNQAALHACEELTRLQLLGGGPDGAGGEPRETAAEARRKRIREMFGDEDGADDNDPYYDRTGTVAKNRCLRKDRTTRGTNADAVADSAPGTSAIVTLMSLETSHSRLAQRLAEIRAELAKTPSGTGQQAAEGNDDEDDLDAYMRQITTDVHQGLRQEMARLEQVSYEQEPRSRLGQADT